MRRWRLAGGFGPLLLAAAGVLLVASGASAQAYWQPQPPPHVTADNQTWFRLGEPITFEGYIYYPAGVRVFFDGNVMVRSGAFRGIPIYMDTTIEAYSRVFVPTSGGLLQPYERRRTGDAAGTTGSRAPSFPVSIAGELSNEPSVVPIEAEGASETAALLSPQARNASMATATSGVARTPRDVIEVGLRPKGLNEIYVTYAGTRWRAAGRAVRLDETRFEQIGHSGRFPVYAERSEGQNPNVIFVPSRSNFLAPYAKAGKPPKY